MTRRRLADLSPTSGRPTDTEMILSSREEERLPAGVYFVKQTADSRTTKVVIQR